MLSIQEVIYNNHELNEFIMPFIDRHQLDQIQDTLYQMAQTVTYRGIVNLPMNDLIIVTESDNAKLLRKKSDKQLAQDILLMLSNTFKENYKDQLDKYLNNKIIEEDFKQILIQQIDTFKQKRLKELYIKKQDSNIDIQDDFIFTEYSLIQTFGKAETEKFFDFNCICTYYIKNLRQKNIFGNILHHETSQFLVVFGDLNVLSFPMKKINHFFLARLNENKEKINMFKQIFDVNEGYALNQFFKANKKVHYKNKQVIFDHNSIVKSIYIVNSGQVQLTKFIKKNSKIQKINLIMQKGSIIGFDDDFGKKRTSQAVSLGESILFKSDFNVFFEFIDTNSPFMKQFLVQKTQFQQQLLLKQEKIDQQIQIKLQQQINSQQNTNLLSDADPLLKEKEQLISIIKNKQNIIDKHNQKSNHQHIEINQGIYDINDHFQSKKQILKLESLLETRSSTYKKTKVLIKYNESSSHLESVINSKRSQMSHGVSKIFDQYQQSRRQFLISSQHKQKSEPQQFQSQRNNSIFDQTINSLCDLYANKRKQSIQQFKKLQSEFKQKNLKPGLQIRPNSVIQSSQHNSYRFHKQQSEKQQKLKEQIIVFDDLLIIQ